MVRHAVLLLVMLAAVGHAQTFNADVAPYITTDPNTPGVYITQVREGIWDYYDAGNEEAEGVLYDYLIVDCDGAQSPDNGFWVHNNGDMNSWSGVLTDIDNFGLADCVNKQVCEPLDEAGGDASAAFACEQTLADIRERLTAPDGDAPAPTTDASSRTAAAFATFASEVKLLMDFSDVDVTSKFPFGYAARLTTVDLQVTDCQSGAGAGLASAFNYCGSGVHTWLAPKVKAALAFLSWLAFAVGVNSTWAQAMA
jgi:hypothetical protein